MLRSISTAAVLVVVVAAHRSDAGDAPISQYYEALRERGLFVIAEDAASRSLTRENLPADERLELTFELAETLWRHGEASSPREREELWRAAEGRLARTPSPLTPEQTRAWLVRQATFTTRRARAAAFDFELAPDDATLKVALNLIESAEQQLATLAPDPRGTSANASFEVRLQQAQLAAARRQLQPADAAHTEQLRAAAVALREAITFKLSAAQQFEGVLEVARLERLRSRLPEAQTQLDIAQKYVNSERHRQAVLAEQLRLDQLRSDWSSAAARWTNIRDNTLSDEVRAQGVAILLQQAEGAAALEQKTELLSQAKQHLTRIRGPWRAWADLKYTRAVEEQQFGAELAVQLARARALWQQGRAGESAEAYALCSSLAAQRELIDSSFDFGLTAASIWVEQSQWLRAIEQIEMLQQAHSRHAQSARADLLRCYAIGRLAADDPQFDPQRYEACLRRHLETFVPGPTHPEAAWLLALDCERRGDDQEAIGMYLLVPPEHPRFDNASDRLTLCWRRQLNSLSSEDRAGARLEQILAAIRGRQSRLLGSNAPLTLVQAQQVLSWTQLILQFDAPPWRQAGDGLDAVAAALVSTRQRAQDSGSPPPPEVASLEIALIEQRILLLSGRNEVVAAAEMLARIPADNADGLFEVLLSLGTIARQLPAERRAAIGQLQQQTLARIMPQRDRLPLAQQRRLDEVAAQSYAATGDLPEAAQIYESLLAQAPQDISLRRELIAVLEQRGQPEDLLRAKSQWTQLEHQLKPGSVEWLDARLSIVGLLLKLGDVATAKKLLGVTRTLYPKLGDPDQLRRAEELQRAISSFEQPLQ